MYKPFPTGSTYLRFNKEKKIGLWANIIKSSQPAKCYLIDSTLKIIGTLPTPEELKINSLYYTYFDNNLQYFISNDGEKNFEFGRIVNSVYNRYPQNFELNSVYFTNPKEGYSYYLNNDQIHLYTTNDSGKIWSNVYSNKIFGNPVIVFGTCKIGYLYNLTGEVESDSLLKTVDGGINWKKEILPDDDSLYNPIKSFAFFDNCFYLLTKSGLFIENEYSYITERKILKSDAFQIYPNPLAKNSQFTISFSREIVNIKEVRLYSVTGLFIRDLKYQTSAETIFCDLPNDINSGVYFVGIEVNNEETFSKIIIR